MKDALKVVGLALTVAGITLAPQSASAYVNWWLGGCDTSSATHGNSCTYTGSDGTSQVTASAWSNTNGGSLEAATLKEYSGGLGVINVNEGTADPNHAADNEGSIDVVLFDFSNLPNDAEVDLTNVFLGYYQDDSDISVLAYTGAGPMNLDGVDYTQAGMQAAGWTTIGNYDVDFTDNTSPYNQPIATNVTSSYWLVGAYNPSFGACTVGTCQTSEPYRDYVKIQKLKGELDIPPPPPPGVSEPGLLVLMLGMTAPLAMRRRRKVH